jgi:hypothetical protein
VRVLEPAGIEPGKSLRERGQRAGDHEELRQSYSPETDVELQLDWT